MDIEDMIGFTLCSLILIVAGIIIFICGMDFLGISIKKDIDVSKWTQTTAKVLGCKYISEIKKSKFHINNYKEYKIIYYAYGKKYTKYIRNLPDGNRSKRTCIYYKNKNPNYIKIKSESNKGSYKSKPAAAILFIMSILVFILSGVIISSFINQIKEYGI